jgi:hypothetical protein
VRLTVAHAVSSALMLQALALKMHQTLTMAHAVPSALKAPHVLQMLAPRMLMRTPS